jgi:hypothetical protein
LCCWENNASIPAAVTGHKRLKAAAAGVRNIGSQCWALLQPALDGAPKNRPEAIAAVAGVMTLGHDSGGRVDSAEDDVKTVRQDVWVIPGQT